MSREDLVTVEGAITKKLGGGMYIVTLENGSEIRGKMGGKMNKFRIKILVGDKVKVEVSPYDPTHGLISYRYNK